MKVVWLAALLVASAAFAAPPADLDRYAQRALHTFGTPGMTVAIVEQGKPYVVRSYGVRRMGEPAKVDEHTLFAIERDGEGMKISFDRTPSMKGKLEHVRYDTFRTRWTDRNIEDAYVTFALNPDGSIERMTMRAISPLADFSYDFQDLMFVPER